MTAQHQQQKIGNTAKKSGITERLAKALGLINLLKDMYDSSFERLELI